MKTTAAHHTTPPNALGGKRAEEPSDDVARRNFLVYAANMSWQLAVVVLLPVIGGAQLDKHFGDGHAWLFVGLGVAFVASVMVVWRMVQLANSLPVPKLTAAEKREIQRSFKEEDEEE